MIFFPFRRKKPILSAGNQKLSRESDFSVAAIYFCNFVLAFLRAFRAFTFCSALNSRARSHTAQLSHCYFNMFHNKFYFSFLLSFFVAIPANQLNLNFVKHAQFTKKIGVQVVIFLDLHSIDSYKNIFMGQVT